MQEASYVKGHKGDGGVLGLGVVRVRPSLLTVVAGGLGVAGGSGVLGGRGDLQVGSGSKGGLVCFISLFVGYPLSEVEAFLRPGGFGRVVFGVLDFKVVISGGWGCG